LRFFQPFGFLPGVDHPMNHREIREHGNHPQHRRRPTLRLHGEAARIAGQLGVKVISLSITHTADLGMAHVILEG